MTRGMGHVRSVVSKWTHPRHLQKLSVHMKAVETPVWVGKVITGIQINTRNTLTF